MFMTPWVVGSSPHTRGARDEDRRHRPHQGIIPAYAGSTFLCRAFSTWGSDHPRIRGEHEHATGVISWFEGSSPHTRGARFSGGGSDGKQGIIPAYAGSTRSRFRCMGRRRDHPRIRGEHRHGPERARGHEGSSPHTRGAHEVALLARVLPGIIPACAGSTCIRPCAICASGDHPRMRGEHNGIAFCAMGQSGSSPHARGALARQISRDCDAGIIPACAGSTMAASPSLTPRRDHPRMRGEHISPLTRVLFSPGSSPHARGAPGHHQLGELLLGIIPACAGSTPPRLSQSGSCRDHPRMRGEHALPLAEAVRV